MRMFSFGGLLSILLAASCSHPEVVDPGLGETPIIVARQEVNLGIRCFEIGDFEHSKAHLRRALELDPGNVEAQRTLLDLEVCVPG